jgi:hypothetical protein
MVVSMFEDVVLGIMGTRMSLFVQDVAFFNLIFVV